MPKMSLERVLKTLENFGLTKKDAKAYVYLAKKGPKEGKDIAIALNLTQPQLTSTLVRLQKKGFIHTSAQCPDLFSAFTFEQILDMMIAIKDEEAQAVRETHEELLSSWGAIPEKNKPTNV